LHGGHRPMLLTSPRNVTSAMSDEPVVFVVDDDPAMRDSLEMLLRSQGLPVSSFDSAVAFLASDAPARSGCVLADVRMPHVDGLELQQRLRETGSALPVILMTGHGDVPLAVRAMKAGAIDFLEKPFEESDLVESVRRGLEHAMRAGEANASVRSVNERLSQLTERERQVLDLLIAGKPNKVIAYDLSISPRTVEIHRARVMEKMGARSLADLVRMTLANR
jgi:two-component system response regulator FixJ